jgi:protein gp37
MEVSLTQIFDRPLRGREFFEEVIRDNLDLGRPDRVAARVKFLSIEPLIGPIGALNLRGIDWVIVGGESGPSARPMNAEWVTGIRNQCRRAKVAFFFKQWGMRCLPTLHW